MQSSASELEDKFSSKISKSFTPSTVGSKEYKKGLIKVADLQYAVNSMLVENEEILNVIPGFNPFQFFGFRGVAILTSLRVFWNRSFVLISDIGDISVLVMPDSHWVVQIHSKESMRYKAFRNSKGLSRDMYWVGCTTLEFSNVALARDFLSPFGLGV